MKRALLLAATISLFACARGPTETRVRSALDLLADVVDPSYALAMDGCIAREEDAVRRAEAGSDKAGEEYRQISARCHVVRAAFESIRKSHGRAAEFVEQGDYARAEDELDQVRAAWRALDEVETKEPPP